MQVAAEAARERGQQEARELVAVRDTELAAVDEKVQSIVSEKERWKESEIGRAGQSFPSRLAELRNDQDQGLASAEQHYKQSLAAQTEEHDRQATENRRRHDEQCCELRAAHDEAWQSLAERWREGLATFEQALADIQAQCARLFPDWAATNFDDWPRPDQPAAAIQFGRIAVDLKHVKNGVPRDERLRPAQTVFDLPALLALDEHPVMAITADEEGRDAAVELMQLVMLRFLTAMPPGKVRFTILDPVGLGENFASFMHLADFDEQLIASRIWTEGRQIEEQLTRLTAHMETVLQKYLRNEFATIHDYNEQAGEVAEPFQVLVVANFPANFSEAAAKKLVSIATSGPRCGVYTLLSVDRKQRLPSDFALADVLAEAVHLDWQASEGRFRWRMGVLERLPLAIDRPPPAEPFNEVVRAAGRAAKDSMKVEVPFELVAPSAKDIWTGSTAKEMVVPIGRAGAMRLQSVRLGRGTSQHLLVCGKTGSGKSTFLHALITNAALYYSPDEVEFYLIDFKKGVEFKTYATHRLPHARVIAIESEREFGLSVLERLDGELRRRGDLFRAAGVQDLADFRGARPGERMPRVLLVVDEFQELFVEDDKLSQEAALLMDRLVRQGRAFGIHVLLGSQTLSGAYSLARSTMGQMAVRVALQCSETDASLILSDERNMAARFLNRPGDAIYNDQNGLLAGNHPFQVVWLSEAQRIGYLRQVEEKSNEQGATQRVAGKEQGVSGELIVFEGDQLADSADNPQLRKVLDAGPAEGVAAQHAWLGSAVAIKEATAATFARHAGSNLLVVGAWDDSALGVLANAVIALAAQNRVAAGADGAKFVVLDGTRPESPEAGAWQRLADGLPHEITVAGQRDTARIINEVAEELARREAVSRDDAPPVYLVIFNGGRFRDLRRGEDDYSFSMDKDKTPSPDKQFAEILRNGPAWGIHTLLWCDSFNNVNRMLDRMLLREFEMRVAFQMSAADSASLLDNPAASRLRQHRGLFASEDLGTLEKFRPDGPPTEEWLAEVRASRANSAKAQ
jgi:energy-coupling factor transporter ATP-binding protein EcfA2